MAITCGIVLLDAALYKVLRYAPTAPFARGSRASQIFRKDLGCPEPRDLDSAASERRTLAIT